MKWFKGVLCSVLILVIGFTLTTNETQAASKKVSLKLSNGGTYYGEVKNGKPHGKGTARWGENKTYSGDWINGKRSGVGKYVLKDDVSYEGAVDIITYTGSWKNDKQNGQGTLTRKIDESETITGISSIEKGTFENNQFKKGTSLSVVYDYYMFSYEDDAKYVYLITFEENLNKVLSGKTGKDLITSITYYKKKSNGLYEGYDYGYEPESSGATYSTGSYKKTSSYGYIPYNSVINSIEDDHYLQEKYTNGKLSKAEKKYDTDKFFSTINANLDKRLPDLKPILKAFATMKKEIE
ncbi:MORN repeat-containing protein [Paenibacillus xylanivorans]|uniref:hypothetical protein n=1 Tax=Paenibacillus xylanivorans TaxID=1705561 RepID=UPI0006B23676|nr:hypothetical protein [Paenibacillus xylanivorans]